MIKLNVETKQAAFNKAYLGIIAQGGASIANNGGCMYRGNNGAKCGVGHLINDDDYKAEIEDNGIGSLTKAGHVRAYGELTTSFLGGLQSAHDRAHKMSRQNEEPFFKEFVYQMKHFAAAHKLDVPPSLHPEVVKYNSPVGASL